jgi:hypothetical protein
MSASEFRFGPIVSSGPASRRIDTCSVSARSRTLFASAQMPVASESRTAEKRRRVRAHRPPGGISQPNRCVWSGDFSGVVPALLGGGRAPWVREMQFPNPFTYPRWGFDRDLEASQLVNVTARSAVVASAPGSGSARACTRWRFRSAIGMRRRPIGSRRSFADGQAVVSQRLSPRRSGDRGLGPIGRTRCR